ncbi:cilia- and flagella-associated protein 43-like [Tachysurus fulvidraco]|uniref:cilia- and flagella-associated protein 43-like n=1 Tax=Tachysurus fulvidraco TaxID=1234273 RepID=UPI000F515977|nr:cilia- and flagella-associated protein 43-like [Tachysurus fulvidraco]
MTEWEMSAQTPGEALKEECQQYVETMGSLKKSVEELQEKFQAIMEENEKLPEMEKLEQLEFNLDVDEQQRLQVVGEQEAAKVRKEIELKNLEKSYVQDVLKKKYWDSMSVKRKSIKAFHSSCEVNNFPMKDHTAMELEELNRVEAIRKMEKADTVQETLENSTAPLEKEEVNEEKGYEVAMSALMGSLSTQYGGSNPYLYNQFSLCTKDQKINQIILIQDVIYKVKTAFNTEFEAVYKQKEQEIRRIKDKNKHIAEIVSKLDLQKTLWEPILSDNERAESVLTVSDSEIKVEKYLAPEQRQREVEQRKEEKQRRLQEKEGDSRERALDDMMSGILEVKKEHILRMEVPPAPEFTVKPEDQWTKEEKIAYKEHERKVQKLREEQNAYKETLEAEMKELQTSINRATQAFDDILYKLYERKFNIEIAVYEEEQRITSLFHSIIIEEKMLNREEELIYRLKEARIVKNQIGKTLNDLREDVEAFRETYEVAVAEDKVLDSGFHKVFCDVPGHIVDQLYKLYKKRPRTQIRRTKTTKKGLLKDSPVLSQAAAEGPSQRVKTLEDLDLPENMPEGLDPVMWERFCLARRTKVESEQKVKKKAQILAEKQTFVQKTIDKEEKAQMEFKNLVDYLNCLQEERLRFSSNVITQLLLKQGHVEVETGDFTAEYSDSWLLHRSVVEDLNNSIRALGKQMIASMVEFKDLHKGIIQQEWNHKRMSMQTEDHKNNASDIQMLHLSKEVQEYLTETDYDKKLSRNTFALRNTRALQEEIHTKNMKSDKKVLEELNRKVNMQKEINASWDLQSTNIKVVVAERENIYLNVSAMNMNPEHGAMQHYQNILQRKNLVDLDKAQDTDIGILSAEMEYMRMKTFPSSQKNP